MFFVIEHTTYTGFKKIAIDYVIVQERVQQFFQIFLFAVSQNFLMSKSRVDRLLQSILNRTEINFCFLLANFSKRGDVLRKVSVVRTRVAQILIVFLFFNLQIRTSLCLGNPKTILIRKFR